jgi:UDP-N-acetylglucosamine--N-acetylmuramyl-(pentapeptide) pyrophosphoryl-undecaprenol N-acetylglucosamine transferase
MEKAGGGWVMRQADLSVTRLASLITQLRFDAVTLTKTAEAAALHGRPDAASLLADQVEDLARPELSEEDEET